MYIPVTVTAQLLYIYMHVLCKQLRENITTSLTFNICVYKIYDCTRKKWKSVYNLGGKFIEIMRSKMFFNFYA